jgi:hypothetical protein
LADDRNAKILSLGISAVLTAILFAVIDFTPDAPLIGTILAILFAWLFIAYFIWSILDGIDALIGLPKSIKDMLEANARAKRTRAEVNALRGGPSQHASGQAATKPQAPAALSPEDEAHMTAWIEGFIKAGIIDGARFDEDARAAVRSAVADWGEASPYAILMSIEEIGGNGQMHAGGMLPALGFLDTKGEQLAEGFVEEVAMLDRVTGGALDLSIAALNVPAFEAMADTDIALDLSIGGVVVPLRWRSAVKYSSNILPLHVAHAYHALDRGDAVATLWSDQGSILMRLAPAQLRSFNARMSRQECEDDRFCWLHRETPFGSGDPPPVLP